MSTNSDKAISTLLALLGAEDEKVRFYAAKAILDWELKLPNPGSTPTDPFEDVTDEVKRRFGA